MNITFLAPALTLDGGTRVIAIYAQLLTRMGHRVVVAVPKPRLPSLRTRVRALRRGVLCDALGQWAERRAPSHFDGVDVEVIRANRRGVIVPSDIPDADVLVATWWETAEWALAMPRSKGAGCYFIQHHEVFDYLPVQRVRATYRSQLHKIVIARWLADVMRVEYGDSDVDLVPNAVDHAMFYGSSRRKQSLPTVGLMYSSTPFKGVPVAIEALRILRQKLPSLRILSFGISAHPDFRDLGDIVTYAHSPPQCQIRKIYNSIDVWLSASVSEGFNLPALEAMACRAPVVSTRHGWPAEAISCGKNGYLVEINNAGGLAERMLDVLLMPNAAWQEMSRTATATAKAYSWQRSAELFVRALERGVENYSRLQLKR